MDDKARKAAVEEFGAAVTTARQAVDDLRRELGRLNPTRFHPTAEALTRISEVTPMLSGVKAKVGEAGLALRASPVPPHPLPGYIIPCLKPYCASKSGQECDCGGFP